MKTKDKKRRKRRIFTAEQKTQAVLCLWAEQTTSSQICKSLGVSPTTLEKWQDTAMEAIVKSLQPKRKQEVTPELTPRLKKLFTKTVKVPDTPETSEKKME